MRNGETYKIPELALVFDLNAWLFFSTLLRDLEGPMPHVMLNFQVIKLAVDGTLAKEDSVFGVGVEGVLRNVAD